MSDCGYREGDMSLADFRRLCVEYGEARERYHNATAPLDYRKEWRDICDTLYIKILKEEATLMIQLQTSPVQKKGSS